MNVAVLTSLAIASQAFDSVPCDLGVLEMKRALLERGATPSSIEVFFRVNTKSSFASELTSLTYLPARKSLALSNR